MAHDERPVRGRFQRLRSDTTLLMLVGFGLFSAGIALVVAPEYSPRARAVAESLARHSGLQSGSLLLGGLVFFSLGIFSRGITRVSQALANEEEAVDVGLAVEQLVADVAKLRTAVYQDSMEVGSLRETTQRLVHGLDSLRHQQETAPAPAPEAPPGPSSLEGDPLLALASGLDQMHARLDERLDALATRVDERLAGLREELAAPKSAAGEPSFETQGTESFEVVVQLEDEPVVTSFEAGVDVDEPSAPMPRLRMDGVDLDVALDLGPPPQDETP